MKYQPVPKDYIFKAGDRIRLGGRGGTIKKMKNYDFSHAEIIWFNAHAEIIWFNGTVHDIELWEFPLLEIAVEEPTISGEARDEIKSWALAKSKFINIAVSTIDLAELNSKLDSMVKII